MIAITARNLWARQRRLVATLLAVALGVAFLAGTLLLSDTLRANFDRLFTQADSGTDVVLRGATQIGSGNATRTGVDASLLPRVQAVPGVADAQPFLEGYGQLLGRDGKPIGGNGPPTQAANWVGDPALNPYRLVAGHAPRAADEVVINRGAAKTGHLALGMTTTLLTPQPLRVHIVGIATFGTADGFGPGTFTGMTLPAARLHLTGPRGSQGPGPTQLSQILVRAAPGVPDAELAARLRPVLPADVQAITGGQLATENLDNINSGFLGFLSTGLTAFAAIALLVAAFSIYNTFSILAAQRGRESALLRALGGTRRQLAVAGLAETLVIGVVGSVAGWAGGIGIAALLKGVFNGFGFALPAGGLVLRASSSVLAVAVGVAATVLAGVLPALRSSRVPPLAALRELAAEPARISRVRSVLGFLLVAGGIGAVIAATTGGGQGPAIAGAVGILAGFVVLGPVAVRPAAGVLGAPIAALRGVGGRLARDNALRNPRRTAATASALMVGVAVATLFTVIGASLKASATQGVDRTLAADLVVYQPGYGGSAGLAGFSPTLAAGLVRLPSVDIAAGVSRGSVLLDGQAQTVAAVDPGIGTVLNLGVTAGSLGAVGSGSFAVSAAAAADQHWRVGSTVPVVYPDGAHARLRVAAIFGHPDITGDYLFSAAGWAPHAGQALDSMVLIKLKPGAALGPARAAVTAAIAGTGQPRVQDRAQYEASATGAVNTILGLVYVMLALAILIALMGVANTLSLSIHERTRELGLLRALGQTRAQARGMVRWESVIIAVFGTLGGVILGTFTGWAVVQSSSGPSMTVFAAPPLQLVLFLVLGAVTGILAGIRPARRAARQNMITAIAAA
jgi:putative ABC transport system permease protein